MRFVIWTPAWQNGSAGVHVLHRLCHMLIAAGYQACVNAPGNPAYKEPIFDGVLREDDIVIYPEIIRGNPMAAKRVVRYMLWYPWHHFGNDRIPKHELVIPYSNFLLPHTQANTDYEITHEYVLELGIIDPALFVNDFSIEKTLTTYWISKCDQKTVQNFPMPKGAIHLNHGMPREEYIGLLKRSKCYYSFDMNSAVTMEAYLCGAECFLVTADNRVVNWCGKSREEVAADFYDLNRIHRFANLAKRFFGDV